MSLRKKIGREPSKGEAILAQHLSVFKIPYEAEIEFHPTRKWRFDFLLDEPKPPIAIECEGGTWNKSRHTTGKGYAQDCIKYNHAAAMGFRVFRFTTDQIESGEAINFILDTIGRKA